MKKLFLLTLLLCLVTSIFAQPVQLIYSCAVHNSDKTIELTNIAINTSQGISFQKANMGVNLNTGKKENVTGGTLLTTLIDNK